MIRRLCSCCLLLFVLFYVERTVSLVMLSSRVRPTSPRTKSSLENEYFKVENDRAIFSSRQAVEAVLPGANALDMKEYLHDDPARIIYACWDRSLLERSGENTFRVFMENQKFLGLNLGFSIDLKVESDGDLVLCKSMSWSAEELGRLLGKDFLESFSLEIEGALEVKEKTTNVRSISIRNPSFSGYVGVTVGGRLPGGPLSLTPQPILKAAALGINGQVLQFASSFFVETICSDYEDWLRTSKNAI